MKFIKKLYYRFRLEQYRQILVVIRAQFQHESIETLNKSEAYQELTGKIRNYELKLEKL